MSSIKKELYNNSFEEVLNQSNISDKFLHVESKKLCKSAMEIYRTAQAAYRGGDEELAFILYVRYCNIIKSLHKRADFYQKRTELMAMFGGCEYLINAVDTAEVLRKSLITRFNERDNSRKPSPINVETLPVISKQNGSNIKSMSSLPIVNQSQRMSSQGFVTVKELFDIINDGYNNILIIDCRPQNDFEVSRLKYVHCVNVPEEIVRKGMSAGTIQSNLSDESKALWAYRSIKEQIILMDWESENDNIGTPITTLQHILLHWDPDVNYKNPILILNGGYFGFMMFYPALTTNALNQRPWKADSNEFVKLEDIEYSNIHEVPMRDERIFHRMNDVPMVDRSSKAAAEKLYNFEELQQEREKLLDQSLLNEQNLLDKIIELKDENLHKYNGDEAKLEEARLNLS